MNKTEESYKRNKEALAILPNSHELLARKALMLTSREDNIFEAKELLYRAIAINPYVANYHANLGKNYFFK